LSLNVDIDSKIYIDVFLTERRGENNALPKWPPASAGDRDGTMGFDIFLKLDEIKGESSDQKHPGEVEVLSWSWGMAQQSPAAAGAGAGKVSIQGISITKPLDVATPAIMMSCLQGKRIKSAFLTMRRRGDRPSDAVRIRLEDVLVSSVAETAPAQDARATEALSLSFSRVEFEYVPQKPDGSPGSSVSFKWDLSGMKP
jgi:type VI secretion system secreted protein Hcp